MGVHPIDLGDCAHQIHGLGAVELGGEGVMRQQGVTAKTSPAATEKTNVVFMELPYQINAIRFSK